VDNWAYSKDMNENPPKSEGSGREDKESSDAPVAKSNTPINKIEEMLDLTQSENDAQALSPISYVEESD